MKQTTTFTSRTLAAAALLFAGLAIATPHSRAQDTPPPPPPQQDGAQPGGRPNMEQMRERQLERMTRVLNLTPDQVTQVKAIDEDGMKQITALRENTDIPPADKREKMMKLREDSQAKIRALLTDEQKPKYDQMLAHQRERGPRGEGGPNGAAPMNPPPPPPQ